jgi:hypothetical protein
MQAELAAAVASGARSHRAKELRDAMYLSVVARHCGLGVPLASTVDAFREDGKIAAQSPDAAIGHERLTHRRTESFAKQGTRAESIAFSPRVPPRGCG